MPPTTTILRAAYIAPMDGRLIRDAGVAISGDRIAACGTIDQLARGHPHATVHDLGEMILLPGLINPHTHLELSSATCGDSPGGSFTDWILSIRERGRFDRENLQQTVAEAMHHGIAQCLRFGVTCVGDISQHSALTRPILRDSPLRAISFGEVLGLAKLRHRFDELLTMALDDSAAGDRLRIGLTPHAPYTVDRPGYEQCVRIAKQRGLPLATHLAETPDERPFLESQSGAFRDLWNSIDMWRDSVETFPGSPIDFANSIGLLAEPAILAHVNYCDDRELSLLSRGRASVVYCPRTHAYFQHPPHRWREMIARGINVAIGTDSCASSPDLNLVDDLRRLHQIAPEMSCESLWQMGTIRAARAMNMQDEIGTLTLGKRADLVAFAAVGDDPLHAILESTARPSGVWIDGVFIF